MLQELLDNVVSIYVFGEGTREGRNFVSDLDGSTDASGEEVA
jgi:hypothetical protein